MTSEEDLDDIYKVFLDVISDNMKSLVHTGNCGDIITTTLKKQDIMLLSNFRKN